MKDRIAVPQLRRLWARTCAAPNAASSSDPVDHAADRIAMYGLGVGLRETLQFLYGKQPAFEAFEDWILAHHDGAIDPARIACVNARIARLGKEASPPTVGEPVLSVDDLDFWEEHGYLVLKGAVSREAASAAEQAVWDFVGARPDDPATWYADRHGRTLWTPLLHHPALDANRGSPRMRAAYAQLLGTDDLVVTVDQSGFNPPERPDWPFPGQGLHWDTSLALPIPLGIQGILYLSDTPAHHGAFRCVPGFHRTIGSWLESLPTGTDPRDEVMKCRAVAIAAEAGDMVLWRDALPHGASPNRGTSPRIVQYITMYRADAVDRRAWL